jgi:exopolysaccharide production protein ExoZ
MNEKDTTSELMKLTAPTKPARRDYLTVQALRFLAAFAVVVLHNSFYTKERLDHHSQIFALGANGVRLFFVISGFVMIVSSQRLIGTPHGWRAFAIKRIIRIVPLYWAVSLFKMLTMAASPSVVLHAKFDWIFILKSFLFIPALNVDGEIRPLMGVGWTLNFEMFFYALYALALFVRIRPLHFLPPVLLAMSALSLFKTRDWAVPAFFLCDPIVLDFLAGILLATITLRGITLPRGTAYAAVAIGLYYLFGPAPRPPYGDISASLLTTLAATAVVAGAIALETVLHRRIPLFVLFMGGASYSLYMVHPIIAPAVPELFAKIQIVDAPMAIGGGVLLASLVAALCYRFVETPLSTVIDRHAKRLGLLDAGQSEASLAIEQASTTDLARLAFGVAKNESGNK